MVVPDSALAARLALELEPTTDQLIRLLDSADADGLFRFLSSNPKSDATDSNVRELVDSVSKHFGSSIRFEATNASKVDSNVVWIEYDIRASKGTGTIELLLDKSESGWLVRGLGLRVAMLP